MLNIKTRSTDKQMTMFRQLISDPTVIIHKVQHNLDGLWMNVYWTDEHGDWVGSIDKNGVMEVTQ